MIVYIVTLCFILFDIVTGLIKALYNKKLNSTALRKGLFHKLAEVIAIFGSGLLEYSAQYVNLGINIPLLGVVSAYICIMELISCMENLAEVNPVLGKLFNSYLEKLKQKEGEENGKDI